MFLLKLCSLTLYMRKPNFGKCWEVQDHSSPNLSADTISCGWNPSMAAVWRVLELLEMLRSNYALLLHLLEPSIHRILIRSSENYNAVNKLYLIKIASSQTSALRAISSAIGLLSTSHTPLTKVPNVRKHDWPGHFGSIPDLSQQLQHVP